jgi:hypothetical protein
MRQLACIAACTLISSPAMAEGDGVADLARTGVTLSLGSGLGMGLGELFAKPSPTSTTLPRLFDTALSKTAAWQFPLSLALGYRPIPLLSFGAAAEYAPVAVKGCSADCSGSIKRLGAEARLHSRPRGSFALWCLLGAGYEWLSYESDWSNNFGGTLSLDGYQLDLEAGGEARLQRGVSIDPYVGLRLGAYRRLNTHADARGDPTSAYGIPWSSQTAHAWMTLGVRVTFILPPRD